MKSLDEIAAELQETAEKLDAILAKLEQHKKPRSDILKQGAIIAAAGVVAATVVGKVIDKVNGK